MRSWLPLPTKIVKPNDMFTKIYFACHKGKPPLLDGRIELALDPGETTGVAHLKSNGTIVLRQPETKIIGQAYDGLLELVKNIGPHHIRYEDYKVYGWKADDHAWASLHTAKWIGAIEVVAHITQIPVSKKMAQHAKAFWTDEKLKVCNVYEPGMKHARDALRHLLFRLCFPDKVDVD
jgi:hypothetical protein